MTPLIDTLKRFSGGDYVGIDVDPEADRRTVGVVADVCALPFGSGSFKTIVCYHVLEHIPDDRSAIAELARVLAPDGIALIQVPWRPMSTTDEDQTATREDRIRRFGQADHVRFYGGDFEQRLRDGGLTFVRTSPEQLLDNSLMETLCLVRDEPVWIATRARSPDQPSSIEMSLNPKRMTKGIVAAWTRSTLVNEGVRSSATHPDDSDSEQYRRMLNEAQQQARKWEQAYQRLRSRWPVRALAGVARVGRTLVSKSHEDSRPR
jgi:hypothetical protein